MTVAIVTDSTASLPSELTVRHGIRVVPLHVQVDGEEPGEAVDGSPRRLASAMRKGTRAHTSRPAPGAFLAAYEQAAADGADAVLSVHISGELSATVEGARQAAQAAPVPVEVVDSRVLGMALGYAVLSAAEAAARGASVTQAAEVARNRAGQATAVFYVDTLEHLRRGGRIGAASALLGSALAIKPILGLADGRIVPLEKVRTASRALSRLEQRAVAAAQETARGSADEGAADEGAAHEGVDIAVHHLDSEDRAGDLADRLRSGVPSAREVRLVELPAVVGAHVGPGTIAVVVSPRPEPWYAPEVR
ncbi:MAG TPA: DegV family protein [Segeticoccus sp.]|uniref:DegV family protein n=1 Tax=Segeticoccus sp. TaxID=2706531 RepID=UPI002D807483|nr:DegV family protein [Segeticoccus sp.]HET8602170.1 DegV family protein [Segeticoccus sp.]